MVHVTANNMQWRLLRHTDHRLDVIKHLCGDGTGQELDTQVTGNNCTLRNLHLAEKANARRKLGAVTRHTKIGTFARRLLSLNTPAMPYAVRKVRPLQSQSSDQA